MDIIPYSDPQNVDSTQKEILVFLHYFGGSAQSWAWTIPYLQQDYQCIALNLPGFGGEPALPEPSIAAFTSFILQKLDELNVESYVLIGHSMSGKIAVDVATNDPNFSVRHLILVAPSPPTVEHIGDAELQRMLIHPNQKEAETTVKSITIKPLTDEQRKLVIQNNLETDPKTWDWWLLEGVHHSIADDAANLFLPITVIASEDDPAISFESILKEAMPHLPDAKLIATKGIGHLSPMEAPEWLAAQIKNALAKD
ncbi:alpha/beta fold hydrolase [uncultured Mucilaginibacter sp.]|uniref:alpha/beta fold hydrolase n=1 Tax=uncultured Mucilaginibacter sp. TaxID=797541 RepID=UPI00260EC89F|nr:alpha/beta fold hydrolase [uncultured Mucilaginibacter sp.]